MTRPRYETNDNLTAEQEVVRQLCERWHCEAHKVPLHYQFDYFLTSPTRQAICEIKCRGKKYDTLILSLHKIETMMRYSNTFRVAAILAVSWPDEGTHFLRLSYDLTSTCKIDMGGRTDRGDSQDIEPVLHIPVTEFKPLCP